MKKLRDVLGLVNSLVEIEIESEYSNTLEVTGSSIMKFGIPLNINYDELPKEVQKYIDDGIITIDDISKTSDGFYTINGAGLGDFIQYYNPSIDISDTPEFQDWHLYFIIDDDGVPHFSIYKTRMTSSDKGAAVSFIPFDDDIISRLKLSRNSSEADAVLSPLMTGDNGGVRFLNFDSDKEIVDYFKNNKSEGSYLLADLHVQNQISSGMFDENNQYQVNNYNGLTSYAKEFLNDCGCFDNEKKVITISDINNLTDSEYNAILSVTSGNVSSYSFAAEVEFHAENSWLEQGAASNMGVGEEKESGLLDHYLNPESEITKEQEDNHAK